MFIRALALSSLCAAAACGGKAASPGAPTTPGAPPPARVASTPFELGGVAWTVAVDGSVGSDGDGGVQVTTAGYQLNLMPWPRSDAFVQTIAEQLDAANRHYQSVDVLHQADHGAYHWELVVGAAGLADGTVLVPDPDEGDSILCDFKVPDSTDWRAALAACNSIARAR